MIGGLLIEHRLIFDGRLVWVCSNFREVVGVLLKPVTVEFSFDVGLSVLIIGELFCGIVSATSSLASGLSNFMTSELLGALFSPVLIQEFDSLSSVVVDEVGLMFGQASFLENICG